MAAKSRAPLNAERAAVCCNKAASKGPILGTVWPNDSRRLCRRIAAKTLNSLEPAASKVGACPLKIYARVALTTHNSRRYPRLVELSARSRPRLTGTAAAASPAGSLAKVAKLVQPHLEQVETRIAQQAAAFDPAIEGYVV